MVCTVSVRKIRRIISLATNAKVNATATTIPMYFIVLL